MEATGFELVEKELVEYVRRYFKGALAKTTEVAVKSSHSKHARDIQRLAAQHYETCVRRSFREIRRLFNNEGILEEMARLQNMAEEQKQFKTTPMRRPTGIASVDTQLLADVINNNLLREERKLLEQLKAEQDALIDELTAISPSQ